MNTVFMCLVKGAAKLGDAGGVNAEKIIHARKP